LDCTELIALFKQPTNGLPFASTRPKCSPLDGNCATTVEFGISLEAMYWAVGVSVTRAAIWLFWRACFTAFRSS
jgi:hypothetical protein